MKSTTKLLYIFLTILTINIFTTTKVSAQSNNNSTAVVIKVPVPKCKDFSDNRNTESRSTTNSSTTPPTYNAQITYIDSYGEPITLELEDGNKKGLKCMDKAVGRSLPRRLETETEILERRNFYQVSSGSSPRHQHSYFTETGDFYEKETGNYYKPNEDYCIKSISDESIDLRVCAANSDCSNSSIPNTYCLPKCCALDETLLFWKRQCASIPETHGRTPWTPTLYAGPKDPDKLFQSNTNVIYHMAQLPQNCYMIEHNDTHAENIYRWSSAAHVNHFTEDGPPQEKDHIRLVPPTDGKNGKIQVMTLYHFNRKWKVENYSNFCVEGFYVKTKGGPKYAGDPNNFVVFYCPNEGEDDQSDVVEHQNWKSWTYIATSLLALLFLVATLLVYLMLWDKHNLHGLTILSYTGSTLGSYFFLTVAHFISLYPNPDMTGLHKRGWFCYAVSVLAHFFYLSSYCWLTVMNFDLWMTFQSIRVTKRDSKEWPKFAAYSGVAFALPAALVIAFVIVDEVYRDPITQVAVPDYAVDTCFVSPYFRGEYVYTPMAITLAINIILISMTMWIFIRARSHSSKTFSSGGSSNMNRYNATLFAKLFLVMGGTSIVDFLTWYYNNKGYKPWFIVALELISYFTPIALFILFCMNDKVIGQFREKYPRFTEQLDPVLRLFTSNVDDGSDTSRESKMTTMSSSDTVDRKGEDIPLAKVH